MPAVASIQTGTLTVVGGDSTPVTASITSVDTSRSVLLFTHRNASPDARASRHVFNGEITDSTTLTFNRTDDSSFAADVTIAYTVVEYQSGELASLQTGSVNSTAALEDVTISTVDTSKVVPVFSLATSELELSELVVPYATFPDSATLRLNYAATPSTDQSIVNWQVVEFNSADVNIQSGVVALSSSEITKTETISSVNTASTFISHGGSDAPNTSNDNIRNRASIVLTDSTTITVRRSPDGTTVAMNAAYYAVELQNGESVEAGEVAIADGNSTPSTQPSFTALTAGETLAWEPWSIQNLRGPESGEVAYNAEGGNFTTTVLDGDDAGVTIQRGVANGDIYVAWNVVDFSTSGGGTTIEGAVTLSSGYALSTSTLASLEASNTLAHSQGYTTTSTVAIEAALTLPAALQQATSVDATFEGAVNLDSNMQLTPTVQATFETSVTLPNSLGIQSEGNKVTDASLTLPHSQGFTTTSTVAIESAITLSMNKQLTTTTLAVFEAFASLAHNQGLTSTSQIIGEAEASISLNMSHGLTVSAQADLEAILTLAQSTNITTTGQRTTSAEIALAMTHTQATSADVAIEGAMNLGMDAGFTTDPQSILEAESSLGLTAALSVIADAVFEAGLSLDAVQSITVDGDVVVAGLSAPDGRVFTVRARVRTFKVPGRDRVFKV